MIPNANRILIEKARAISAIRERKWSLRELIDNCKHDYDKNDEVHPISLYGEKIFNKEDYYLYRAVLKFYHEDYRGAVADFKTCLKFKNNKY